MIDVDEDVASYTEQFLVARSGVDAHLYWATTRLAEAADHCSRIIHS